MGGVDHTLGGSTTCNGADKPRLRRIQEGKGEEEGRRWPYFEEEGVGLKG